jgi:NAD(P)-dependent dehydrogenase (short-subunit alcohol dehydrogenase family)
MATAVMPKPSVRSSRPLEGKLALITGSSRGIGRAIGTHLAGLGATLAINYRNNLTAAMEFSNGIEREGGVCQVFQADVSEKGQARRLVDDVLNWFQHIDILINNAGITRDRSIRKMTDGDWAEVIETNLNSVFYCTSAVLPSMIERKYGRIVNIASFSGQAGNFGQANYAASKGGIIAMTKVLALELAKYNITANVIAPGFTNTEMLSAIPCEILAQLLERIPMRRFAEPEEIAKAAAFLICDGDYITGQQINVNGGIYM